MRTEAQSFMIWSANRFEARSIQPLIMGAGLRGGMVGASERVDSLCGPRLDDALLAVGAGDGRVRFSRRTGGACHAFSEPAEGGHAQGAGGVRRELSGPTDLSGRRPGRQQVSARP